MPPREGRGLLATLLPEASPIDLRILGRTLLHAAVVGAVAGLVGAAFFAGLEIVQRVLLEMGAGFHPLRASGETFLPPAPPSDFRPLVLLIYPAGGALISGLLTLLAPEARGGGGDATIRAFHEATPATDVVRRVSDLPWQDVFPVLGPDDVLVGMITPEGLRILAGARELAAISVAADVMQPAVTARVDDDARSATQALLNAGLPEIPVVDETGKVCGFLGETEVARAYMMANASRV